MLPRVLALYPRRNDHKLVLTLLRLYEANGRYVECKVWDRTGSSRGVRGVGAPGSVVSRVVRWIQQAVQD